MELSCKVRYALVALLELASHYERGEPLQTSQIAATQQIPDRYLEQLLTILRRGGFVRSQRGSKGGYLLAKEPWQIALMDVLICLEGTQNREAQSQPEPIVTAETSVIQEVWQEAVMAAKAVLQGYTLQDLCQKRDDRQLVNVMYYI